MHAVLLSALIFIPSFIFIKMPLFPFLIRFFLVSDPYYWLLLMQPALFNPHLLSFPCTGILCAYSSAITASPPLSHVLKRFEQQVQRVGWNFLFLFLLIEDKKIVLLLLLSFLPFSLAQQVLLVTISSQIAAHIAPFRTELCPNSAKCEVTALLASPSWWKQLSPTFSQTRWAVRSVVLLSH